MTHAQALITYGSSRKAANALGLTRSTFCVNLQREKGLCERGACQKVPATHGFCEEHYARRKEIRSKHHAQHKARDAALAKAWEERNRDKRRARKRNWDRIKQQVTARRKSDIQFRLKDRLRTRMNSALKRHTKSGSAVADLGCSIDEFKAHLESKFTTGMSWDNYGKGVGKWNIDHIIPLNSFNLTDRSQFLKAAHYTNMQPLWWHDNIVKSDRTEAQWTK